MIEKECKVCEKTFRIYAYRTITAKVCSYECSGKVRKTEVKRMCRTCSNIFYTKLSQFKYYKGAGKYCSRECSYKGIVKETEKKPIRDKFGRSGRLADRKWKEAIREKDGNICQKCGIYQEYIHTHHVATRARRPDLKHDVSNGICLCNSCHSWVHNNIAEAERLGYLSKESYEKSLLQV